MRPFRPVAVFALLLIAAFAGAASRAETTGTDKGMAAHGAKLLDWGIYETDRTGRRNAPRTASGSTNTVGATKLVRKTDRIMAQLGLRFGIRYRLGESVAPGEKLTFRVTHPPLSNPKTGKTSRLSVWTGYAGDTNARTYIGYGFDHRWELAEGMWTIEVVQGNRVLVRKRFQVVIPLN